MKIFVDTSALVAAADRSDKNHSACAAFFKSLTPATQLHISNYIVDEVLTRLRFTSGHQTAAKFGKALFASNLYERHFVDKEIEQAAFNLFLKYRDQEFSFTDCTSFALMRSLGIRKALAFDDDFRKAGFDVLL